MIDTDSLTQFTALTEKLGFVQFEGWTLLELVGDDRKSFLHNFCTADVKGLADGNVTEAFVLDGKGKTIGHVHVAALEDRVLLTGSGDQGKTLLEHLDRYLIREKVTITDRSSETAFLFLGGVEAASLLRRKYQCELPLGAAQTFEGDIPFWILHTEIAGSGFLVGLAKEHLETLVCVLNEEGGIACSPEVLEAVRIQQGTPWFGIEIGDANLPQEFERDEKAISFDKGCYLGQETVARIDALGRVNKLLRIGQGDLGIGELPAGSNVQHDGKDVGTLLASVVVPGSDFAVASLMLKRGSSTVGQALSVEGFELKVVPRRT